MQEDQRKKIEAKLNQLLAEFEEKKEQTSPAPTASPGIKLIRRRKGEPDVRIP